jgi:ribonuclease-3
MREVFRRVVRSLPAVVCGHRFRDATLLEAALTHPSSTDATESEARLRYQRLEFLGDAVWTLFVSEALCSLWPTAPEGELTVRRTGLVSAAALARMATAHGLAPLIALSRGEESAGGRERVSILSSVFEAVIGAIYLDGGHEEIRRLAYDACLTQLQEGEPAREPKGALQEFAQSKFGKAPRYHLIGRSGPPHAPIFEIEVRVSRSPIARGQGRSKQEAERAAALAALGTLTGASATRSSNAPS